MPNLQRQQQQQDRTRHPVRHLRGPPDADAKQMEQEAMTPTQRKAMEQALEKLKAVASGEDYGKLTTVIDEVSAALAEQPAEPVAWMPIATAPKGRIVLVYYKNSLGNGRTMRARYYLPETLDSDITESGWADEGWYEESEAYEYLMPLDHEPTHWMPLPAAPDTAPHPKAEQPAEQEPAPGYCKHCKQYTIEEPLPAEQEQEPVSFIEPEADNDCAYAYADGWNACLLARKHTAPHTDMHPFLVRDLAELIGSTVPDVCNALEAMGIEPRRSTNAAVTPDEALAVARRLAQPAKPAEQQRDELLAALELIANTGMDARQCMLTASAAIAKVEAGK